MKINLKSRSLALPHYMRSGQDHIDSSKDGNTDPGQLPKLDKEPNGLNNMNLWDAPTTSGLLEDPNRSARLSDQNTLKDKSK